MVDHLSYLRTDLTGCLRCEPVRTRLAASYLRTDLTGGVGNKPVRNHHPAPLHQATGKNSSRRVFTATAGQIGNTGPSTLASVPRSGPPARHAGPPWHGTDHHRRAVRHRRARTWINASQPPPYRPTSPRPAAAPRRGTARHVMGDADPPPLRYLSRPPWVASAPPPSICVFFPI